MKFYRYQDVLYYSNKVVIEELVFKLIKETNCGYWITDVWDHNNEYKRWMSKTARKRYACPTRDEALISFKARKRKQIKILEQQLNQAKIALNQTDKQSITATMNEFEPLELDENQKALADEIFSKIK